MSDIPSDIHRQILRRVPAESLFRFRSVCKDWRRIIDDPQFVKMHLHRPSTGGEHLFIRNSTGKLYSLPLTCLEHSQVFTTVSTRALSVKNVVGQVPRIRDLPVASCDGLLLVTAFNRAMVWLVWNPFTGESIKLPLCDDFVKGGGMHRCGIGYDAVNDDYKVVRIAPGPDKRRDVKLVTLIYSMNSNKWHRIADFGRFVILDVNGTGVFMRGSLYWLAQEMGPETVECIVALDLTTETFRKVSLPLGPSLAKKCSLGLHVLGDNMFLSCSSKKSFIIQRFGMWMMTDYGSENTWIMVVSLKPDGSSCLRGDIRPVAYLKDRGHVLVQVFNEKFMWYDVNNKCIKHVKIVGLPYYFSSQVFPASLVRLKGNGSAYHEGVESEGTLKRKRSRADDRLELKIKFSHSLRSLQYL